VAKSPVVLEGSRVQPELQELVLEQPLTVRAGQYPALFNPSGALRTQSMDSGE